MPVYEADEINGLCFLAVAYCDGPTLDKWLQEQELPASPQLAARLMLPLAEAARVTAKRLGLGPDATEALVQRYHDLTRERSGPGVKPLPPLLYAIAQGSRDHTLQRYREVVLPTLAAIDPPPKARVVQFQAGVHGYEKAEPDLPRGLLPAILKLWDDAIKNGYYLA